MPTPPALPRAPSPCSSRGRGLRSHRVFIAEELPYKPTLTQRHEVSGQITGSTFVLEQPRCAFDNVTAVGTATSIWLVVAEAAGRWWGHLGGVPACPLSSPPSLVPAASVSFPTSVQPGLPQWAFQNFPTNTSAYLTLEATILNYPCSKNPAEITVLRVGSESSCAKNSAVPTCNGPLPGPGPYK